MPAPITDQIRPGPGPGPGPSHFYLAYGRRIESSVPLTGLGLLRPGRAYVRFHIQNERTPLSDPQWFHTIKDSYGKRSASYGFVKGRFIIRMHGEGDFLVSLDGREVWGLAKRTIQQQALCELFVGHILPLALNTGGHMLLHASAVRVNDHAIIFVGNQGYGKSTLAAAFQEHGYGLIADDAVVAKVGRTNIQVLASHPRMRLTNASLDQLPKLTQRSTLLIGSWKNVICAEHSFSNCSARLAAVYFLEHGSGSMATKICTLSPLESAIRILDNAFRLDLDSRKRMKSELARTIKITERVPMRSLWFPRKFNRLKQVVNAVLRDIESFG